MLAPLTTNNQGFQQSQVQTPRLQLPPLQTQQPQQGGGVNPMQAYNMYSKFAGGGASGSTGATTGVSAGGSSSGGMAAAGPWAALAAAIVINEDQANSAGRRDDDRGSRGVDMLSGAVLQQDAEYYGDKVGGPFGKLIEVGGQMGNPEGVLDFFKDLF